MTTDGRFFRVLGPLTAQRDGQPCSLGGPRQRLILALLLASANHTVSRDELIEGVWGEALPGSPRTSLHSYVSNLRRILGEGLIDHGNDGYIIRVGPESYDVLRFEELTEAAGACGDDPETARCLLDHALGLWVGPAFGDLRYADGLLVESHRLEELRVLAEEERIETRLALGQHRLVVAPLRALVERHPLRERLCGQLMVALYRSGRQADSLRVFRDLRGRLGEELGVEPSPELWRLEERILMHDSDLGDRPAPAAVTADRPYPPADARVSDGGRRHASVLALVRPLRAATAPAAAPIRLTRDRPRPLTLTLAAVVFVAFAGMFRLGDGGGERGGCLPAASSLAAWWPGDGTAEDVVGGEHAMLVEDATHAEGMVGEAFRLDGDGDYIEVGDRFMGDFGMEDFTVAAWVRFATLAGEQVLAEKWVQRYDEPSWGWTLTKLNDHSLGLFTEDPAGEMASIISAPLDVTPDRWVHLAGRRRGDRLDLLMDGGVIAYRTHADIADLQSTATLKFGHRGTGEDTGGSLDDRGRYLNGSLDEIQITVGEAMSDTQIAAVAAAEHRGVCLPNFRAEATARAGSPG